MSFRELPPFRLGQHCPDQSPLMDSIGADCLVSLQMPITRREQMCVGLCIFPHCLGYLGEPQLLVHLRKCAKNIYSSPYTFVGCLSQEIHFVLEMRVIMPTEEINEMQRPASVKLSPLSILTHISCSQSFFQYSLLFLCEVRML